MKKRVLCLLVTGFEEIETVAPIDLLRRAEAEVIIATLGREKLVTGRCGVTIEADPRRGGCILRRRRGMMNRRGLLRATGRPRCTKRRSRV